MRRSLPGLTWKAIGVLALVTAFLAAITFYALLSKRKPGTGENPGSVQPVRAVFETRYLRCGCISVEERELQGGSAELLSISSGPTWQLAGGRDGISCFFREIDDYCPEHSRFRLITIKDGVVAVYRGKRAIQDFLVRSYPALREDLMMPATRQTLANGVVLEGEPATIDETVDLYIEGIID
jgi:hypothetical protein